MVTTCLKMPWDHYYFRLWQCVSSNKWLQAMTWTQKKSHWICLPGCIQEIFIVFWWQRAGMLDVFPELDKEWLAILEFASLWSTITLEMVQHLSLHAIASPLKGQLVWGSLTATFQFQQTSCICMILIVELWHTIYLCIDYVSHT